MPATASAPLTISPTLAAIQPVSTQLSASVVITTPPEPASAAARSMTCRRAPPAWASRGGNSTSSTTIVAAFALNRLATHAVSSLQLFAPTTIVTGPPKRAAALSSARRQSPMLPASSRAGRPTTTRRDFPTTRPAVLTVSEANHIDNATVQHRNGCRRYGPGTLAAGRLMQTLPPIAAGTTMLFRDRLVFAAPLPLGNSKRSCCQGQVTAPHKWLNDAGVSLPSTFHVG